MFHGATPLAIGRFGNLTAQAKAFKQDLAQAHQGETLRQADVDPSGDQRS
jgi:hypothetical protein